MEISERDIARFWSKVALPDPEGHLLWLGGVDKSGYGRIKLGGRKGRQIAVHRLAYELRIGPIPEGLVLDHLCRVRHCVASDHLEPVTNAENIRRGDAGKAFGAMQRAKTHCPQGHPYAGEHLRLLPEGRGRACRTCGRERLRAFRQRKRDAAA